MEGQGFILTERAYAIRPYGIRFRLLLPYCLIRQFDIYLVHCMWLLDEGIILKGRMQYAPTESILEW